MKYAFVLATICLGFVLLMHHFPSAVFVWTWCLASFALVSAGYAFLGVGVFGKRQSGEMLAVFKILNLPYLLFAGTVWYLWRLLSREDAYNEVNANLIVGRRLRPHELPGSLDYYVDLTAEFEEPLAIRRFPGYRCLPILDAKCPDPGELLALLKAVSSGRTFIHCAQGHGRTGLVAAALLLYRGEVKTVSEAVDILQEFRSGIELNSEQKVFMEKYWTYVTKGLTDGTLPEG
jgi:hypothetical protein